MDSPVNGLNYFETIENLCSALEQNSGPPFNLSSNLLVPEE